MICPTVMMKLRITALAAAAIMAAGPCFAQTVSFQKNFTLFKDVAPGIDLYAHSKSDIAAFEKPVREARQKLAAFLGNDLARGAVIICSTMEQKDSVQEKNVLKLGYAWVLIQLTPEATAQQMIAAIKARLGNMAPPGILDMIQKRSPEQKAADEARMIGPMVQRMCFALLEKTLLPDKEFKSSRLDDLSRSPLADWLDLGLAWYASGTGLNIRLLQERLDEAFPLEDVLSMPRPFVAPQGGEGGAVGGGAVVIRSSPGTAGGGSPPAGTPFGPAPAGAPAGGGPMLMTLPKDMQDRMIFDYQSASFFSFLLEKVGIEKVKTVVRGNLEGKLAHDILTQPDLLGPDVDKTENDWRAWVKSQKPEEPLFNRMMMTPGKAVAPPH